MSEEIQDAAKRLAQSLRNFPWFVTAGVGVADNQEVIHLYVIPNTLRVTLKTFTAPTHEGYPVLIHKMSKPKAGTP